MLRYPRTAAVIAGAAAAMGFEPLALWPLALAAMAVLVWLIRESRDWKQAALAGWLFGFGHFAAGNGWIATAFTYQAQMPAWLGWAAVLLLALYLALYPSLAAATAWWLSRRHKAAFVPAFAATWIVGEWLRSWVFTGFAWNPLGMIALGGFTRPGLASVSPWMGTYALSGLVVLLAGCWLRAACLFDESHKLRAVAAALLPAGAFLLPAYGSGAIGTLPFTLVQPDIRQEDLNNPAKFEDQFRATAALSRPARSARRLVLWPESGIPDMLRPGYPAIWYRDTYAGDPDLARARIGRVIGPDSLLLTGAVDLAMRNGRVDGAWNVVTAIDGTGAIRASYAKAHLVPYGEYLPMRSLLEPIGLSRLVAGTVDFRAGPGPRTLDLGPWGKAGVQICYEIIFSGRVADGKARPDYIFNPSNDGWFGAWGPPQHLAQARMRAIEEGLPVLRSTTTGISAVIDAEGVVRRHLPQHRAGKIEGLVPPAAAPTLFSRMGNALSLMWAALLLTVSMVATRRGARYTSAT